MLRPHPQPERRVRCGYVYVATSDGDDHSHTAPSRPNRGSWLRRSDPPRRRLDAALARVGAQGVDVVLDFHWGDTTALAG